MSPERHGLTGYEGRVWLALLPHRGREAAIGAAELSRMTGLSDRRLRRTIKSLIEVQGCAIASTPSDPAGYYLVADLREVAQVCEGLKRRALSILRRMTRLKRTTLRETVDQLLLEIEDAA